MKLLIVLIFIFSYPLYAKEITEYDCELKPDQSVELTLIDPRNPSFLIKNKSTKIARCFYQTLPSSKLSNKTKIITDKVWYLKILKCENYNEKMAKELRFSDTASFRQSQKLGTSYLRIFSDQHPLTCQPKPTYYKKIKP